MIRPISSLFSYNYEVAWASLRLEFSVIFQIKQATSVESNSCGRTSYFGAVI